MAQIVKSTGENLLEKSNNHDGLFQVQMVVPLTMEVAQESAFQLAAAEQNVFEYLTSFACVYTMNKNKRSYLNAILLTLAFWVSTHGTSQMAVTFWLRTITAISYPADFSLNVSPLI